MTPVDVNEPRKTSSFINARMFNHKLDFSATYSNISCFKYTANCMHYLLFCHSRPCKLNWCRHKSIPQLLHFFPPFFLGWKWVGSRLSMHSQNQQERFHMPFGSHILASCHILYDISIFNCAARLREEKREKQRKSGAILARQQWAEASWVRTHLVVWWDTCRYIITVRFIIFYGATQQGEQCHRRLKTVSNGALSIST